MKQNRGIAFIGLLFLVITTSVTTLLGAGILLTGGNIFSITSTEDIGFIGKILATKRIMQQEGYSDVKSEDILDGALKGMASAVGDKYTEYLSGDENEELENETFESHSFNENANNTSTNRVFGANASQYSSPYREKPVEEPRNEYEERYMQESSVVETNGNVESTEVAASDKRSLPAIPIFLCMLVCSVCVYFILFFNGFIS